MSNTKKSYWAIYDERMDGFRSGEIYTTEEEAKRNAAALAIYYAENAAGEEVFGPWLEIEDFDTCPISEVDEINDSYGYAAMEVSEKHASIIDNSNESRVFFDTGGEETCWRYL